MAELYMQKAGAATSPAIVFLHGGGISGRMWQPQIERLSEYYCLAPDLPEHAQSASIKPFTLQKATSEVVKLIQAHVPSGKANIVGLSVGGAVGLELLCTHPEVINRAILSGTTPKVGRILAQIIGVINMPILALLPRHQLAQMTIKGLNIPAPYDSFFIEDMKEMTPDLFRNVNQATTETQIPQTPIPPTLVIAGEKETRFVKSYARTISQTVQGATGKVAKGVGHAWNLEVPDLFNEVVRAWFTEKPLPSFLQPLT
jgi:pimeloyl-ACP methyl ester carboxylesterase